MKRVAAFALSLLFLIAGSPVVEVVEPAPPGSRLEREASSAVYFPDDVSLNTNLSWTLQRRSPRIKALGEISLDFAERAGYFPPTGQTKKDLFFVFLSKQHLYQQQSVYRL